MNKELVLGIDIGGSHITAGIVDLNNFTVSASSCFRADVDSKVGAEEIIDEWANVINSAFATVNVFEKKIGIAMPGPFDYDHGISYVRGNNKFDALYGLNVKQMLADKLSIPSQNILMLNDAASFLKGEVFAGSGVYYHHVIGLTLGTGLGTATFHDDITVDAGLWDSLLFEGIAEEYISTRWFLKYYFKKTRINIMSVKELNDIADESEISRYIFRKFAYNLSEFLDSFVKQEKPEAIIIGGNISKAAQRFLPELRILLKKKNILIPVYTSKLGEWAVLIGAASCWAKSRER